MSTELLEIQPRELKFVYELKKQSSCTVRLLNKTGQYVAFKVKTTSPKKYCVRPNVGIVKPKSLLEFLVTMQAPHAASPDVICKDKFLVQSSVVPHGTTDDDITPSMFLKDDDKYVEEKKLKVIFVSPPNSPVLSPVNVTLKSPDYESSKPKDQVFNGAENISPSRRMSKEVELKIKDQGKLESANDVSIKTFKEVEEPRLDKEMEEMKLKVNLLESKLGEADGTVLKLKEERKVVAQEGESLRHELALLRRKKGTRRVQVGFPLLYVCMVALIGFVFGYRLRC